MLTELLNNKNFILGVSGTLVGSLSTMVVQAILEHLRRLKEDRRAVLQSIVRTGYKFTATLTELDTLYDDGRSVQKRAAMVELNRDAGEFVVLQHRAWAVSRRWQLRAALSRTTERVQMICQRLEAHPASSDELKFIVGWFEQEFVPLMQECARAAGVPTREHRLIRFPVIYTGRNRTAVLRRLRISSEPPPWEFAVIPYLQKKPDPGVFRKLKEDLEAQVGKLRCKKHRQAIHVILEGQCLQDKRFRIETCCEDFHKEIHQRLSERWEIAK